MKWLREIRFFIFGVITFIHMMFTNKDPHTHLEEVDKKKGRYNE